MAGINGNRSDSFPSFIRIRKYGRSDSITYIGSFFKYFFIGMVSFPCCCCWLLLIPGNYQLIQPVILAMYALATFVSGGILRFRPLIWGGDNSLGCGRRILFLLLFRFSC